MSRVGKKKLEVLARVDSRLLFRDRQDDVAQRRQASDYITVYEWTDDHRLEYFVFSALAPGDERTVRGILGNPYWEIPTTFGHPFISSPGGTASISYAPYEPTTDKLVPFVIDRSFRGARPSYVEMLQEFCLYHRLYFVPQRGGERIGIDLYVCMRGLAPDIEVVRLEYGEFGTVVRARYDFVRDFLAAKGMVLVRLHEHRARKIDCALPDSDMTLPKKLSRANLKIEVFSDARSRRFGGLQSVFSAKDVIMGLRRPLLLGYHGNGERNKVARPVSFQVRSLDGRRIQKVSFRSGIARGLPPVFFQRGVLSKYYERPSHYEVEHGLLRCSAGWVLRFHERARDLVYAGLGDIAKELPREEQLHWQQHNVAPKLADVEDAHPFICSREIFPEASKDHLLVTMQKLNRVWAKSFGSPLFRALAPGDEYCQRSLHVPFSEETKEFDEQMLYMAKLFNESIQLPGERDLQAGIDSKGPIDSLERFLEERLGVPPMNARHWVKPLRDLQSVRSAGAAHRRGRKYSRIASKSRIGSWNNKTYVVGLMDRIADMLEILMGVAGGEPKDVPRIPAKKPVQDKDDRV
jgi:hypothetical protein